MAIRTISNTGGNYNATGTWVEGAVPTSADDVVATATSGQLTVNVASAAQSFNFTNYTNTLTMNNAWTVSGTGTQTFVAAMTIVGSSNISLTGTGATIVSNGKLIPNLSFSGSKTIGDTLNVTNISLNNTQVLTSNSINCSGNFTSGISNISGTTTITLSGTGTISMGNITNPITINSSGTLTGSTIGIGLGSNGTMSYIAGTLSLMKIKVIGSPITINQTGPDYFETIDNSAALTTATINTFGTVKSNYINIQNTSNAASPITQFAGTGTLQCGHMFLLPFMTNVTGVIRYIPQAVQLNSTGTHSFTTISSFGFTDITTNTTSSATASTISAVSGTAKVNISDPENCYISNTNFTNVDASYGSTIYVRGNGSLSGTTNIVKTTVVPAAGGVAGGSFTFVN